MPKVLKSRQIIIHEDKVIDVNNINVNISENKYFNDDQKDNSLNLKVNKKALIEKVNMECEELINQAKREAERIVEEAESTALQKLKRIEEVNSKLGFDEGYNKGLGESAVIKKEAEIILKDAELTKIDILKNIEPEVVDLISNILDKIFFKTIETDKNLILALVKQGVDNAKIIDNVSIFVSDADYETVMNLKDDIFKNIDTSVKVEIKKDRNLTEKACIIETPFGNIECDIKEQFSKLKDNLYYILETR